ncbi:MAG: beta-lactamase family protein [Rhodobiaceae bacterium]|nr:beta-lactamase family protein [Rhodobiaceae bacterium]
MTERSSNYCVLEADGKVVAAEGGEILPLYSLTKTLIAALIVTLELDQTRFLSDWLDKTWVPSGHDITLRHLLNHTSGLRDYGGLEDYHRAVACHETAWAGRKFADATLLQPLLFPPGKGWAYSNPGFWALKRVLEIETGQNLHELVQTHIATPLQLPSLAIVEGIFSEHLPDYPAEWVWHGLACSNTEDIARFMASPLAKPLTAHKVSVPNAGPTYPEAAYGLGVMTDESGNSFGHNGSGPGFSTSCFHFPKTGITASVLMPYDGPDDAAYSQMRGLAARHGAE